MTRNGDQERRPAQLGSDVRVRHLHDVFAVAAPAGTDLALEARLSLGGGARVRARPQNLERQPLTRHHMLDLEWAWIARVRISLPTPGH
jgi:hypothetical protein